MLKVYGFGKVNSIARGHTRDLRVLWTLEELQMPFELVGLDHPAHELNTEAYRRLSPFEQIPAIDDDGVVISESAAVVVYLAKKAKQLIPVDLTGEAQVLRWCFAAMNSVEIPLLSLLLIDWAKDTGTHKHRDNTIAWADNRLAQLDRWLENRDYIATDSFTVADILMAHVLEMVRDDSPLKACPRVTAYRDRCFARPAWKKVMAAYCERVEAA